MRWSTNFLATPPDFLLTLLCTLPSRITYLFSFLKCYLSFHSSFRLCTPLNPRLHDTSLTLMLSHGSVSCRASPTLFSTSGSQPPLWSLRLFKELCCDVIRVRLIHPWSACRWALVNAYVCATITATQFYNFPSSPRFPSWLFVVSPCSCPNPRQPLMCFPPLWFCPFLEISSKIMEYAVFWEWLLSLRILFLSSSMLLSVSVVGSFLPFE